MAKVIPIGQPVNDAERQAIAFLRDHLPADWLLLHNFEIRQGREVFEIDIALLTPHAVYVVDVKGTHGLIEVYGSKWYPSGRQQFHSPLAKLREHAKSIATIIRDSNPALTDLRKLHVHATVLLTANDAILNDPSGIDGPDVTDLKHCLKYFNDTSRIPSHRSNNITRFHSNVIKAITGIARPKTAALVFRDWQVEEKLGGTDRYTEYRAKHSLLGKSGGMVRLKVYQAEPYQEEAARKEEFKKISNAYRAVAHMSAHPNVLAVKDLFINDEEDKVILVTEDVAGQPLNLHFKKPSLPLTFDQKLQILRDVLSALDHAHKSEVIHRNLTPDAVIVTKGGESRVTSFDFARVGKNRTSTIAEQIVDDLDVAYQAPECFKEPDKASIPSDLYAAGLIFYKLLTGTRAFKNIDEMLEADGKFLMLPSALKSELPIGMDEWLQKLCAFDPEDRYPSAAVARKELDDLILPEGKSEVSENAPVETEIVNEDLDNLPQDYILANRFRIQNKLGSGGFGVAYKVFDSFADVVRVIKLVTKDRRSVYERLRREYKTLTNLPEHPHVVKVVWADRMQDAKQTPYLVFEYVEGLDVSDLVDAHALSIEDSVRIAKEAAEGLAHLHANGVYHQDVKPSNLLWTDTGVRIIDFNVSVSEQDEAPGGGGTRRYIPPDYDYANDPSISDRIDRDLYALGITLYECLTGNYPFDTQTPPIKQQPKDPRQFKGCSDISNSLLDILLKLLAPARASRFSSMPEFLTALAEVKHFRSRLTPTTGSLSSPKRTFQPTKPNTNPFVSHLLTLYSQSQVSNAGTRGLDEIGKATYVATLLDKKLKESLFAKTFRLVIITGNAGDGKTAFIQQFEGSAEASGAQIQRGANGSVFKLAQHLYQTNYDGSQDEGDEQNDAVLKKFFAPFVGISSDAWPMNQTRIIAINEGRLVDFLADNQKDFAYISKLIESGLSGADPIEGIAVVNLNLRSVVADVEGQPSILERLIRRMTEPEYWKACEDCDLKTRCYAYHNAQTFQDQTAGPKVLERLKMLYSITHLRGRLHITMRDLRSALSYMLVGTRDCDEIHSLYQNGGEDNLNRILSSFYFNSWYGGDSVASQDRLLSLLREIDIAQVSNPDLDRELAFLPPRSKDASRFSFGERQGYDDELIETLFNALPRDYSSKNRSHLIVKHRTYLSHVRRRNFFERRDYGWTEMLPYKSIGGFLKAIQAPGTKDDETVKAIIKSINRGEGLTEPNCLGNQLALKVRDVDRGTIKSFRLFDGSKFLLSTDGHVQSSEFLEWYPQALLLRYMLETGQSATLRINLDVFEMLMRLNSGYRPSIEEEQGIYLSLTIFKNVLAAAPYQQVLLSENNLDFFEIRRDENGILHMSKAVGSA